MHRLLDDEIELDRKQGAARILRFQLESFANHPLNRSVKAEGQGRRDARWGFILKWELRVYNEKGDYSGLDSDVDIRKHLDGPLWHVSQSGQEGVEYI